MRLNSRLSSRFGVERLATAQVAALSVLAMVLTPLLCAAPARAQSALTYVSGRGSDSNACTPAAPCLTLQGALAKTAAGGQIYALNSANYGYVTINKAVSIVSGRGATGVLAASQVSGITVNAGANDVINLQGLHIDGASSGANGVLFTSGAALNIKDSVIRGFGNGIAFQPTGSSALSITSTLVTKNGTGLLFQNSTASTGVLNDVQLVNNGTGVFAQGSSSTSAATVTIQKSVAANNSVVGIQAGAYSSVRVANSTISNNAVGLQSQSASSLLQVSQSSVTANATGWTTTTGGQLYSASNNSIGGNTSGNSAPLTEPAPAPTTIAKNIVTDFGARCDGVADDNSAFNAFHTWALSQILPITLTIPNGSICTFITGPTGNRFAAGVKNLTVIGYGATLSDNNGAGNGFFLGSYGVFQDNAHSARVATVSTGESTIKLLNNSHTSLFSAGRWALITGFDLQGQWQAPWGYPQNPAFFEYVQIQAVDTVNGLITFTSPLKNTYKATWPNYNSGNAYEIDNGGPATLYALDSSWDTQVEYRGLTISQPNRQTYANGRTVTFRDVKFTGSLCGVPTQNLVWQAINTDMSSCVMEADKLVDSLIFTGSTISGMDFQSASINMLTMIGSTIIGRLNGTPKEALIDSSTIATFRPGAYAYGRTQNISCNACVITNIDPAGILDKGPNDVGINVAYTMSNGTIAVPNAHGAVQWATPGATLFWQGEYTTESTFQIVDVTQDASNAYIQTSLSGGFPPVSTNFGKLFVYSHPAPKFTCTNCTGGAGAADLSRAPTGAPLFSYSKRTYTGNTIINPAELVPLWGKVVKITVNVIQPYTGGQGTLTLNLFGRYKSRGLDAPDYSRATTWNPSVNLKIAGTRTITPTTVMGIQIGDDLTAPGPIWFAENQQVFASANINSEPSTVWPIVEIEVITDQW